MDNQLKDITSLIKRLRSNFFDETQCEEAANQIERLSAALDCALECLQVALGPKFSVRVSDSATEDQK